MSKPLQSVNPDGGRQTIITKSIYGISGSENAMKKE